MKRLTSLILGLLFTVSLPGQYPGVIASQGAAAPVTSPITKTFTTWTDAVAGENLVDGAQSGFIAYSRDAEGSAKFVMTTLGSNKTEYAAPSSTTETWETIFGVPAGKTVTKVELTGWKKKLAANTDVTSLQYYVLIVRADNVNTKVTDAVLVATVTDDLDADADFVALTPGSEQSVTLAYQASNYAIKLKLVVLAVTSTANNNPDIRFDDITIKVTFTD